MSTWYKPLTMSSSPAPTHGFLPTDGKRPLVQLRWSASPLCPKIPVMIWDSSAMRSSGPPEIRKRMMRRSLTTAPDVKAAVTLTQLIGLDIRVTATILTATCRKRRSSGLSSGLLRLMPLPLLPLNREKAFIIVAATMRTGMIISLSSEGSITSRREVETAKLNKPSSTGSAISADCHDSNPPLANNCT